MKTAFNTKAQVEKMFMVAFIKVIVENSPEDLHGILTWSKFHR